MKGQCSKGEWKVHESPFAPAIIIDRTPTQERRIIAVCRLEQGSEGMAEATANAYLAAAAVNACAEINPDNPMAAAGSVKDTHEALEDLAACFRNIEILTNIQNEGERYSLEIAINAMTKALAKAKGEEVPK